MSGLFQDEDLPPPPDGPGLFGEPAPAAVAPTETRVEAVQAGAYRVLARTYRPTTFDDLIGQDAMVRILRNAFSLGRIAHAFMLTGVRGVGKTTTARIVARALNCVGVDGTGGPTADPCGVCANCVAILADRHPDVIEMDAASRTGVDDVREIIDATRFRPLQARAKVFIIDEVHMLSRNAFNALLKTLEEPPPHVKFIFATTEIRKVPVTVLSRCQRFDLRRIPLADLAAFFGRVAAAEGVAISPGALDLIARAADGSARDGLSLLDQAIANGPARGDSAGAAISEEAMVEMLGLADRGLLFDLFEALMQGRTDAALAVTDRAHERGADLGLLLSDLLDLTHILTRIKSVPGLRDGNELPEAERTRGAALADRLSVPVLGRTWQMLLKGVAEVEAAPDRRAAAEMVLIRLCYVADLPPPGELVRRLTQGGEAPASGPSGGGGGGAMRSASGGGQAMAAPAVLPDAVADPAPSLRSFRDVVALAADRHEISLHAHLLHSAHLVRFAPPVIELRTEPDAPRDLAARLATLLQEASGVRWTIALSTAAGEATIAAQGNAADASRRETAAQHPLVLAIMAAFPGAKIESVRDHTADRYGLAIDGPAADAPELALGGEPDMPEFAPLDAESAGADDLLAD
jgi:DNA polymerase-3 subunit gamma/tau